MSNDGYNVNPPVPENIRPVEPPKAPPLPSTERELRNRIRELQEAQFMTGTVIFHGVTRKIRECDFLTEEQQEKLVSLFWQDR